MSTREADAARIFLEAVEQYRPDQRTGFVEEACASNPELWARVNDLIKAHNVPNQLLDDGRLVTTPQPPLFEKPGTQIGPYKLVEQIGEGGMGVVFVAEQDRPVRRRVAMKVVKPGMDTREVIGRFEAERQALAMMEHPNIAKVFNAGTTDHGRPYFVMELVQGVPITEYCDECNLTTRERLELFMSVCYAVQHAHQKGVIHRDIKPTNILVAMQDGRPAPKIIDFGVAKAIGQRLTEQTVVTGFAQMIGTPTYMSPEQAELSPLGADTRSDIYSLGVVLYELLTGTIPLDENRLQTASYDELRRLIREEEPPRPSARISTLAVGVATTVAERRRTDPNRLRQTVCGELDWIVMKCLEKDSNRRYQTAAALALDLQRYLHDEHVEACPPSTGYRLHKFARRNKTALLTAGLVAVALVVGSVASFSQAIRAKQAETLATARLHEATEASANAEANAEKARHAVDDMYTQVAEKWLAHQPQMEPVQREFLEKALQFYTEFAKEISNDPAVRFETARAYRRIAEIQHRLGQTAEAKDAFVQATNHLQLLVDEVPSVPEHRAELAAALHKHGVLLGDTGRSAEEEQVHRRALMLEQKLLAEHPDSAEYRRDIGRGHWFLGQALLALQRWEEAEQQLCAALDTQNNLVREFPTNPDYRQHLAQTYLRLGLTLRRLNRPDECQQSLAEAAEILEALMFEYPTLPDYRNELANVYYWHVENDHGTLNPPFDEAVRFLKRAIEIQSQLAADYPSVTDYRYDWFRSQKTLGRILMQAGRYEEAESVVEQAATTAEKLTADAPTVHYYRGGLAFTHIARGELLTATGRHDEGEAAYREAIRLLSALVAELPAVAQYREQLRRTYDKLESMLSAAGRTDEVSEFRRNAGRPPDIESREPHIDDNSETSFTSDH